MAGQAVVTAARPEEPLMDDLSKLSAGLGGTPAPGAAGDPAATDPTALVGLASAVQASGGLDGLIGQLRQAGLGDEIDSWIGTGENKPVDPQRLGAALGPDTVQQLSSGSGLDIGALLPMLAAFLPQIINMLTPNGSVPEGGLGQAAQGALPDLGGLIGGMLGGAGGSGTAGSGSLDDLIGGLGGMLGGDKGR
jgi:uncharacterized protein YidB (DUF937 family)